MYGKLYNNWFCLWWKNKKYKFIGIAKKTLQKNESSNFKVKYPISSNLENWDEKDFEYDNLQEMKNSYKSLQKIKTSLEGSLQNPNLSSVDRQLLEEGLNKAIIYINKIVDLFKPFWWF